MRRKRIRKGVLVLLSLLTFSGGSHVCADTPYRSYDRTEWSNQLAAPDTFVPSGSFNGTQTGSGAFDAPLDMAFDAQGRLFVADTGNNRIVILDQELRFVKEIHSVRDAQGETDNLREPSSVYVAQDGAIYVADTDNNRGLKLDEEGNIQQQFLRPEDKSFTSETFSPIKIMADGKGMVYIISRNVFQGIMLYNQQGAFEGYFGSPQVNASFQLLLDRFWKSILSREQREGLARYVPVEYSGFALDDEGFVFAVQSYTDTNMEQIRKLNYLGNNILPFVKNFGESEAFDYKRERWYTKFIDVDVEDDFIYALDSQWQRVYLYDRDGNRLTCFGTQGEQLGAFRSASAVKAHGNRVYVLDRLKANVTIFERTAYGKLIFEAVGLYNEGSYSEAVGPWRQVLAMDANNELAYTGIGEAMLKSKEYGEAVRYFRLGFNRERESVAYDYYRSEILRKNIGWVLLALFLIVAALVLFTNKRFLARLRRGKREEKPRGRFAAAFKKIASVLVKPVEGYNELKFKRYRNLPMVAGILFVWLFVKILDRQFTGFRFNLHNPDEFSLLIQIAVTVAPFLLFAAVNWAVCAIMDGEGRFGEILTFLAIALVPDVLFSAAAVGLSNVLVLKENVILLGVSAVGMLWSLLLLFQGQRIVHNYTSAKTAGAILLTVFGMAVVLVILLLLFSLSQQVVYFIQTVYSELMYRK